jgi:hypothetical protein
MRTTRTIIAMCGLLASGGLLAACVGSTEGPEAGIDGGQSCDMITPQLDDPVRPGYPVMDLGPCLNIGDTCRSMANCMLGRATREWSCTCEGASQHWVCGVTMYCMAPAPDAME